jgi:hypothetical protein
VAGACWAARCQRRQPAWGCLGQICASRPGASAGLPARRPASLISHQLLFRRPPCQPPTPLLLPSSTTTLHGNASPVSLFPTTRAAPDPVLCAPCTSRRLVARGDPAGRHTHRPSIASQVASTPGASPARSASRRPAWLSPALPGSWKGNNGLTG